MRIEDFMLIYMGLVLLALVLLPACWLFLFVVYEITDAVVRKYREAREWITAWRRGDA